MLNFCIFVFVFYALFAIVKMLFCDYSMSGGSRRRERRRPLDEKNSVGVGLSQTTGTDKAYF
ncbi:MAG: hypothetical protein IJV88_02975 [Ruminococcus sp.]|nr:hypothetical protein [Ruminococcus sp.]